MPGIHPLIGQIQQELQTLEAKIRGHPYLQATEGGVVPKDRLKLFVGEQHHILESDLRSMALLVSRTTTPAGRRFALMVLQGEDAALGALHKLAGALGLDEPWLQAFEPSAEAQAYPHFMAWMATFLSEAEVAGALLVNFAAWGANCGRLGNALKGRYGLSAEAVAFFDLFAAPPSAEFLATAAQAIDDGLTRGVPEVRIRRAARLLQAYELMFWDGLHRASSV